MAISLKRGAKAAGSAAKAQGLSRESCPFVDEGLAQAWSAGWDEGEIEEVKADRDPGSNWVQQRGKES